MRLSAYGFLLGSFMLSSGNIVDAGSLAQGGALAVLGGTIWYMLAKVFPEHNKAQREAMEEFLRFLEFNSEAMRNERNSFLEAQKEAREDNIKSLDRMSSAIDRMVSRCSK